MRIALIAPPWLPVPPPAYGGTEGVIDRLARGLAAEGHDVTLFGTGDSTCPVPLVACSPRSVPSRMNEEGLGLAHELRAYQAVDAAVRSDGPFDVLHDHTVGGALVAALAVHGDRTPIVVTNHGAFDEAARTVLSAAVERSGAAVVALSGPHAATAGEVPVRRVIHHGIDLDRFPPGPGGGGYLLFLGRMAPDKGAREAALVARAAGRRLLIAAKCRERAEVDYFEREVRPLLGGGVEYLGEVDHARRLELLRHADALLNPIQWPEPFGLAMIEALATGTPVLTCKVGSATELIDHGCTGFVVDEAAELVALVDAVDRLDRAVCRRTAEVRFSAARMVHDHLALYEALCRDVRRSTRALRPSA